MRLPSISTPITAARTPVAGHDSELGRGEYGQSVRIRRQALGQGSVRRRRRIIQHRPLPLGSGLIVFVSWREQRLVTSKASYYGKQRVPRRNLSGESAVLTPYLVDKI